jgi:hypothetical protein
VQSAILGGCKAVCSLILHSRGINRDGSVPHRRHAGAAAHEHRVRFERRRIGSVVPACLHDLRGLRRPGGSDSAEIVARLSLFGWHCPASLDVAI